MAAKGPKKGGATFTVVSPAGSKPGVAPDPNAKIPDANTPPAGTPSGPVASVDIQPGMSISPDAAQSGTTDFVGDGGTPVDDKKGELEADKQSTGNLEGATPQQTGEFETGGEPKEEPKKEKDKDEDEDRPRKKSHWEKPKAPDISIDDFGKIIAMLFGGGIFGAIGIAFKAAAGSVVGAVKTAGGVLAGTAWCFVRPFRGFMPKGMQKGVDALGSFAVDWLEDGINLVTKTGIGGFGIAAGRFVSGVVKVPLKVFVELPYLAIFGEKGSISEKWTKEMKSAFTDGIIPPFETGAGYIKGLFVDEKESPEAPSSSKKEAEKPKIPEKTPTPSPTPTPTPIDTAKHDLEKRTRNVDSSSAAQRIDGKSVPKNARQAVNPAPGITPQRDEAERTAPPLPQPERQPAPSPTPSQKEPEPEPEPEAEAEAEAEAEDADKHGLH